MFHQLTKIQQIEKYFAERMAPLRDALLELKSQFPKQKINILSIGFGDGEEIPFFNTFCLTEKIDFRYDGIEIDNDYVNAANEKFRNNKSFHFHQVDAQHYEKIKELTQQSEFQVILVRHPVFFHTNPASHAFQNIFSQTIPFLLAPKGCLIVSFYHEIEKASCLGVMQKITGEKPQELKEDTSTLYLTEVLQTDITDMRLECYSDRYMLCYKSFAPIAFIQLEKTPALVRHDDENFTQLINQFMQNYKDNIKNENDLNQFLQQFTSEIINTESKGVAENIKILTNNIAQFKTKEKETINSTLFAQYKDIYAKAAFAFIKYSTNENKLKFLVTQFFQNCLKIMTCEENQNNKQAMLHQLFNLFVDRPITDAIINRANTTKPSPPSAGPQGSMLTTAWL